MLPRGVSRELPGSPTATHKQSHQPLAAAQDTEQILDRSWTTSTIQEHLSPRCCSGHKTVVLHLHLPPGFDRNSSQFRLVSSLSETPKTCAPTMAPSYTPSRSMPPNSENILARLLLAIIHQMNLRDVDWDKVARDPVLIEPIPNGHAARMRFARYRNSVTAAVSAKRNRVGPRHEIRRAPRADKRDPICVLKPDPEQSPSKPMLDMEAIHNSPPFYQFHGPSAPPQASIDANDDKLCSRLLTPCSDDMPWSTPVHTQATRAPPLSAANNSLVPEAHDKIHLMQQTSLSPQFPLPDTIAWAHLSQDWTSKFYESQ
ncbi:hypothetical protein CDD82_4819 [Ophiocordyceps australis]|uniref:Myb-like DNA-binding domain-containing protein n=1 Tax=Ophiocordyceps australis TaxID=1399860 RepID=A0A2C5Z663_9HYPO|nr:hypothetical protein CDD82_4819 [Ophiocordyceps australis]